MNDIDIIDLIIQYLKILKKHLKQKNKEPPLLINAKRVF